MYHDYRQVTGYRSSCYLDTINVGITRSQTNTGGLLPLRERRLVLHVNDLICGVPLEHATVRCDLFISGSANGCSFSRCYGSAGISKLVQTAQILHLPKYDFLCIIYVRWLWFVNVWRLSAWVYADAVKMIQQAQICNHALNWQEVKAQADRKKAKKSDKRTTEAPPRQAPPAPTPPEARPPLREDALLVWWNDLVELQDTLKGIL